MPRQFATVGPAGPSPILGLSMVSPILAIAVVTERLGAIRPRRRRDGSKHRKEERTAQNLHPRNPSPPLNA